VLILVVVLSAPTFLMSFWARALRRRTGWAWLGIVPWLLILGLLDAVIGTTYGLIHAFNAVRDVDPSMKASALANGISWAMSSTVIQAGVIALVFLVLLLVQLTTRERR
jgi:hypothetical protein